MKKHHLIIMSVCVIFAILISASTAVADYDTAPAVRKVKPGAPAKQIAPSNAKNQGRRKMKKLEQRQQHQKNFIAKLKAIKKLAIKEGAAETAKRPRFVDVAPSSKISYVTNNSSEDRKWFIQPMCGGVAIFD